MNGKHDCYLFIVIFSLNLAERGGFARSSGREPPLLNVEICLRAASNTIQIFIPKKFAFNKLAERGGFEPPISCDIHAFQACALGHYATSPRREFRT